MSGREWQPGDVLVSNGERGIVTAVWGDGRAQYVEMASGRCSLPGALAPDAHPLAAIDPEDREQVARLVRLFWSHVTDADVDATQAALREFINPKPRIEEPMGLGAVVQDMDGSLLVRAGICEDRDDLQWMSTGGAWFAWSEIDVAKVLSEGVQP